MPAVPIISAVTAVGGLALQAKGASDARKAANQAANAPAPTVDIPALQTQAQNIAQQNAAASAALERQYNPGASELRAGSLQALLANLNPSNPAYAALSQYAAGGAPSVGGGPELPAIPGRPAESTANQELLNRIAAQAGQPLTTTGFDSALTRQAVEAAARDLAQGGTLPQDVRNLVARNAAARSGAVANNLRLGRDITARDLGLTSLDIYNRRLQNASTLGSQEAALEQANAVMRAAAEQYGRNNLLQSQQATAQNEAQRAANYATDAQIAQARAALEASNYFNRTGQESSNYFNQANLLQSIANGDFSRAFSAAQLGQNIAQPTSGLDPGSIANLAVGNQNAIAAQQQNAAAIRAQAANQQSQLGGQLLGAGLGFAQNFIKPAAPTYSWSSPTTFGTTGYTPPATNYSSLVPAVMCWVAREVFGEDNPEWVQFRDWLLSNGSPELVDFYAKNGESIAHSIKGMPAVKTLIKHLMVAAKEGS